MASSQLPTWALFAFFLRGSLALALGIALLVSGSDLTRIGTYLAVYWIVASLLTLRWTLRHEVASGRRVGLLVGGIGLGTGVMVLLRLPLSTLVDEGVLMDLLGLSVIATGLLRVFGRFHDDQLEGLRPRRRYRVVVGALELALGAAVIAAEDSSASTIRVTLGIWGLLTGTFLILDALWLRRMTSRTGAAPSTEESVS
ncbi:MAG TPA: hypothetical protein VFL61_12840 [Gaiellaceae bacterium]|nr:hypothetical protein [Gaiellaceae bacterium]